MVYGQNPILRNSIYRNGLPWWLSGKESACQCRRQDSILGSGRSLGGGNCKPTPYICLKNIMDREVWQTAVHGVTKSWPQLSNWTYTQRTSAQLECSKSSHWAGTVGRTGPLFACGVSRAPTHVWALRASSRCLSLNSRI